MLGAEIAVKINHFLCYTQVKILEAPYEKVFNDSPFFAEHTCTYS